MSLIVADTGPINYLIQIGHIDLLSRLVGKTVIPFAAAARGLISFPAAIEKLRGTSFFITDELIEVALRRDAERRRQRPT